MKLWLLLLASMLVVGPAQATQAPCNALILIRTGLLPQVDPTTFNHRETILWPAISDRNSPAKPSPGEAPSRLLCLLTGLDWQAEVADRKFAAVPGGGGFRVVNWDSLRARGYYSQLEKWIGRTEVLAVADPGRPQSANPDALVLASNGFGRIVHPVPFEGPWPAGALLVFEARSWQEARDLAIRCEGRAVIAEYVVGKRGKQYGSYWLEGRGWPVDQYAVDPSVGVAGLVRARNLGLLLLQPSAFQWADHPDSVDPVPRWIDQVAGDGAFVVCGIFLFLVDIGFAMFCLGNEERGPIAATIFVLIALAPPALLVHGALERIYGIDNWALLAGLTSIGVVVLAAIANAGLRLIFPGSHPLLAPSIIGLAASLAFDPQWSLFSGIHGAQSLPFSAEGVGLMIAYLTGTVAFSCRTGPAGVWFRRIVVVGVLVSGLAGGAWTGGDRFTAVVVPVLAFICGEGWFRWPFLFILAFVPHAGPNAVQWGFAWVPEGALRNVDQSGAVNLYGYFEFLIYPGTCGLAAEILYGYVMGGAFIVRQLRRTILADPRLRAIPWAAAAAAAWAIFNPAYLPAAVLVAYAGLLCLFCSAIWTLEP